MKCFHSTQEQIDERRAVVGGRMRDPKFREIEINYLARLNGKPVAFARLMLAGGMAYLGGAGTLPEFRGHKIYATLVRRRLEDAHARGYQLAVINAGADVAAHRRSLRLQRIYAWITFTAGCP